MLNRQYFGKVIV